MSRRNQSEDYRKGPNAYRGDHDGSDDSSDEDNRNYRRERDRSPLRRRASDDKHRADRETTSSYGSSRDTSMQQKQKLAFGFSKKPTSTDVKKGIQIKLGPAVKLTAKPIAPTKTTVASVFNADDDDEPEEMPAEARMRMRNIGRETPTSAGPNSFGKTKQGFCDSKKIFEKTLKKAMDEANNK
ncbi:hypothetical protein G9C98_005331 [Cotesia typhae]|uniref:PEST proteolytic signal-containing nuclear protein n=1 Tax=Cotesia typhae TaxID=2053667 RepID=A0A8J5RJX2_9HYME|nr:hypothetical protein G9C98_005331 [Cotesia typhae]